MQRIIGIYGYSCTRSLPLCGAQLVPVYNSDEAHRLARDENAFHLTAYLDLPETSDLSADAWWLRGKRIADAMTFCEQRYVLSSKVIEISQGDTIDALLKPDRLGRPLTTLHRRQSFGSVILEDQWEAQSRADFITTFVARVESAPPSDPYINAAYRMIEAAKLATPLIELEHFLFFSGLELLARGVGPRPGAAPSAAESITGLLRHLGFGVSQPEVQRWASARNAAFHRGQLEVQHVENGQTVQLRLTEQLYPLATILTDAVLRLTPFDDGHINWNRWRDRQPFC